MKISNCYMKRKNGLLLSHAAKGCLAALVAVLIGVSWGTNISQAQQPDYEGQGEQVLTRGPVHEAFAGIVTYTPEPGVVVTKLPPEPIEELPPDERPEGDNVAWIPGYWAWDDERNDFLWVSGTWRALPPGRQWIAGYWARTSQGNQWTSGYWADAAAQETTYLPPPPPTVEAGPNIIAPSPDYIWIPGCWIWYNGHYAWRPGYWVLGRSDWDWYPSHYVWTPRGCVFVDGFWDYSVARRGVLCAPVYFENHYYARHGYFYSPRIVIDLGVFTDHLFLRPRYCHYYFGDYYAPSYRQSGFYASFSFHFGHRGYDPIYSHERWRHRRDRDWERRVESSYHHRRDNENARPLRTYAAQRSIEGRTESRENHASLAAPIEQIVKRENSPMRFQSVPKEERQLLAQRTQEVQKSREQRRTIESTSVSTTRQPGATIEPAKVKLPRSPIVAKSVNQLGRNEAPPKVQPAPKPNPEFQRKSETSGRESVSRSIPKTQSRQLEAERKTTIPNRTENAPSPTQTVPGRSETAPGRIERTPSKSETAPGRSQTVPGRTAPASRERQVQPQPQPRAPHPEPKIQEQLRRIPNTTERTIPPQSQRQPEIQRQPETQQRANEAAVRGQEEVRKVGEAETKTRQEESKQRVKEVGRATQVESQQRANEAAARSQEQARSAREPETKARESQQRVNQVERATQESQQRANAAKSQEQARSVRETAPRVPQELQRSPKEMERSARPVAPPRSYAPAPSVRGNSSIRPNQSQPVPEQRRPETLKPQKEKDKR